MLQIAVHFHEKGNYTTNQTKPGTRRKVKLQGYQIDKLNYRVLKIILGDIVQDIPRSRIVHYRYIMLDESERWRIQGSYFLVDLDEALLPQIEAVTKTEKHPRVYLWRDEQWWSFPQLETYKDGEMESYTITTTEYGSILNLEKTEPVKRTETRQIEKTKIRIRETYEPSKGPGFQLARTTTTTGNTNPAGFPLTITGNGMVLEWRRGYDDKPECWWLADEKPISKAKSQTYKHYAAIKATPQARWSRGFKSWYYTGGSNPPQKWLDLVGYNTTPVGVMPAELSQQIEDILAQDDEQPLELIPLTLVEANYGRHEWRYGNPDVWCKLYNRTDEWILFVANANLTERSIYGYKLQLASDLSSDGQPNQIISGEWLHLSIPDLDTDTTQRDPNFTRQSLYQAVRGIAHLAANELPDEVLTRLAIPSDGECRRLAFQERQRELTAELEAKRVLDEHMKPYHQYQAMLQLRQRFNEHLHLISQCKALPAMATPPLDDPWS